MPGIHFLLIVLINMPPIKRHIIKNEVQPEYITSNSFDKIKQRDNLKKEGRFDDYRIARNEVSSII